MTPESWVVIFVGSIVSGTMGLVFRRLGAALALLQSLDKRVALIEQRLDASDSRAGEMARRIAEVEQDVDVIRLDHARNHGHEYTGQTPRPLLPSSARALR